MKTIFLCIFSLLAISSCHNIQKQNNNETAHISVLENIENNMVSESQDAIIDKNMHGEEMQNNSTSKSSDNRSINEIRFDGWTDKDWLDNDYIRTLRKYIDAYCRREIKNPDIDQYRSIMQSKFAVLNIEPFIAGGTFITIVFLDNPQCVFNSWVYSEVDSNYQVVDYVAKGLRLVETEYPMTKDEILEIIKEHPEHRLW